jgi:phosphoglycolate phosphatase-like HAD superfamily hydrolase
MLCTRCNEVIKPVVAIDIDGTLGDYHGHFLEFACAYLDRSSDPFMGGWGPVYDGIEPFREWFCVSFGADLATFRAIKLAYRQGAQKRTMPAYPGTRQLILSLRSLGAEVWLTTTRPHDRFDRVDPDTREWLSRNRIDFDALVYDSDDKYAELVERVGVERVAGVLDDEQEQLARAVELFGGGRVIKRTTQYNEEADSPTRVRVGSLLDARAVLLALVQDWAISHAYDELPTTEEKS